MKTVGIIGGLSPESTVAYYQWINDGVRARMGGHHNARILLNSLDFGQFVKLKDEGDWDSQAALLCDAARSLEQAGADFIVLATNTMHKMADQIIASISIPFLHLADATAQTINVQGLKTIGLLGTRYTMELDFYKDRLIAHGLMPVVPDEGERTIINDVIYNELCNGIINENSRAAYRKIMHKLVEQGAEGIILGCTEITLLVHQADSVVPVFDTTRIHVDRILEEIFR